MSGAVSTSQAGATVARLARMGSAPFDGLRPPAPGGEDGAAGQARAKERLQ
jgi:hypothetical protein